MIIIILQLNNRSTILGQQDVIILKTTQVVSSNAKNTSIMREAQAKLYSQLLKTYSKLSETVISINRERNFKSEKICHRKENYQLRYVQKSKKVIYHQQLE